MASQASNGDLERRKRGPVAVAAAADHKTVTITTGLDVYFADPRSPGRRGTNENTSRLLRQYLHPR